MEKGGGEERKWRWRRRREEVEVRERGGGEGGVPGGGRGTEEH